MRGLRWILRKLQRLLREYVADEGRSTARQLGVTTVGAGLIGIAIDQEANQWLLGVIVFGAVLIYYGTTRDRSGDDGTRD